MGGKIDIQIEHRKKVLRLRRLDRLVQSEDFTAIWNHISRKDRQDATRMIYAEQYAHFKCWLLKQLDLGFELYSIRNLRDFASKHHVRYYSRKTRAELIKALTEKGVLDGNTCESFSQDETTSGCRGR